MLTAIIRLDAEPALRSNVQRLIQEYVPEHGARLGSLVQQSDFPYNRSWTHDLLIGGRDVNLDIKGKLK